MALTRELLGRMKRYLSVPAALILSVALRSALARLSVPWSVHWVAGRADGIRDAQWCDTAKSVST
jgi:hypothetical protein